MATIAFATSCSKEESVSPVAGENQVSISFAYEEPTATTRTFFNSTATAEAWEKSLSTVTIYAFKTSGEILVERVFNSIEVVSKRATFAIPSTKVGDNCEFYAVANMVTSGITSKSDLLAQIENSNTYNGEFGVVNTSGVRASGFLMSGTVLQAIASGKTNVAITLKRTVAKVAIETSISPSFYAKYAGDIRVNSATISRSATTSNVISQATLRTGAMNLTLSQSSNLKSNKFQNLFYIFENSTLVGDSKVTISLNATYDRDGNFETIEDQVPVTYLVKMDGAINGEIMRNGYYRLQVNIVGLIGSDVEVSVTVADWETTATQSVNVGE